MDHSIAAQKAALRGRLRGQRRARGPRRDGPALAAALHEVLRRAGLPDSALVAGFLPTALEPDVLTFLASVSRAGGRVVLPRTLADHGLAWVPWTPGTTLGADRYGLRAPLGDCDPMAAAETRAVLVPALALDATGHRLGQGGGYYDRALQQLPRWPDGPLRVGVTHPEGMLAEVVPHAPHDEAVDVAACATHWWATTLWG